MIFIWIITFFISRVCILIFVRMVIFNVTIIIINNFFLGLLVNFLVIGMLTLQTTKLFLCLVMERIWQKSRNRSFRKLFSVIIRSLTLYYRKWYCKYRSRIRQWATSKTNWLKLSTLLDKTINYKDSRVFYISFWWEDE